jgi:hypothetical protein
MALLFVILSHHCRRCFQVLGFDEYIESHGDGLQILRYNQTTAYSTYLPVVSQPRNDICLLVFNSLIVVLAFSVHKK